MACTLFFVDLKQAAALFLQTQRSAWPNNSTVETTFKFVSIVVDVGTEVEPVSIAITAHRDDLAASVEILTRKDRTHNPETLAKLGGALVQASNLVDQVNSLAGGL